MKLAEMKVEYCTPVNKYPRELEKGDIIKFEYGDYDNWVTGCVERIVLEDENWVEVVFSYVSRPNEMQSCFSSARDPFSVIGRRVSK